MVAHNEGSWLKNFPVKRLERRRHIKCSDEQISLCQDSMATFHMKVGEKRPSFIQRSVKIHLSASGFCGYFLSDDSSSSNTISLLLLFWDYFLLMKFKLLCLRKLCNETICKL